MSSRKRRQQINEDENPLVFNSNTNSLDAKTIDAIGFDGLGELGLDIAAADTQFQAIEAISIHNIVPNLLQPRYAIPHVLRNRFAVHADNMSDIFEHWLTEIATERKHGKFDLDAHLIGEGTDRGEQAAKPEEDELTKISTEPTSSIEKSFLKIVDLAASIRRDGLTNPVSLVQRDNMYEIETGERRWIAYHLLYWKFGDNDLLHNGQKRDWSRIPARVVREVDVWRQASENNARDNLNAISRARQLALLLMDIHGWENFVPFDEFDNEQDFYAQVSDGTQWRVPRGQGERLLNAMGLSDASQIRQYRALLRLSPELWQVGDEKDLTEGELRKLHAKSQVTLTPVTGTSSKTKKNPIEKLATDAISWREQLRKQISTTDKKTRKELRGLIEDEITQLQQLMDEFDNLD